MNKKVIGLMTLFLFAVGFFIFANQAKKETPPSTTTSAPAPVLKSNADLIRPYNQRLGTDMAKVKIVEFLDTECGACAQLYPTVKGVVNDHKDQVQFVVRYMLYHKNSKVTAQAAEAAGRQGKYWEMLGTLFHDRSWVNQPEAPMAAIEKFASQLGLNMAQFRKDMKDPEIDKNIEQDFQEGPGLGVQGTPTIFVNGRQLTDLSYDALKKMITEEAAK